MLAVLPILAINMNMEILLNLMGQEEEISRYAPSTYSKQILVYTQHQTQFIPILNHSYTAPCSLEVFYIQCA